MAPKRDLTGKKFGRLTVIRELPERKNHSVLWLCRCECGNKVKVKSSNLNSGNSQSCGCLRVEHSIKAHQTHKSSDTKLFAVWCSMRFRCNNPNDKSYHNYGARGIRVCDEWTNSFSSFYNWALSNGYNDGLTIDRINNDGNYEPSNCRWTSRKVQGNNSRKNRLITIDNETKTLSQWCEQLGLRYQTIEMRLYRGWDERRALGK